MIIHKDVRINQYLIQFISFDVQIVVLLVLSFDVQIVILLVKCCALIQTGDLFPLATVFRLLDQWSCFFSSQHLAMIRAR